jgi:acyl dehydratase
VKVGDAAQVTRAFSREDLEAYSRLSGHQVAGGQVPEPLIGALFSCLLGMKLPGLGTNYLKQETRYQTVAAIGEALTARVEITRLRPGQQLVDLATTCRLADGSLAVSGRALVYVGDLVKNAGHEN